MANWRTASSFPFAQMRLLNTIQVNRHIETRTQ